MLDENGFRSRDGRNAALADDNIVAPVQRITRLSKSPIGHPAGSAIVLPNSSVERGIFRGRNPREGYQRGWGLQFGDVAKQVSTQPLYREARAVSQSSILTEARLQNLFLIITKFMPRLAARNIIEFGSYRGGTALFMAYLLREIDPKAVVYALDTFTGIPQCDKKIDHHDIGDFAAADLAHFQQLKNEYKLANLKIIQGKFEDALPKIVAAEINFGIAHIDCDTYAAVSFCENAIRNRMVQGGYIVFDDAETSSCLGATQAVEEIVMRRRVHSEQVWPHFVFRVGLKDTNPTDSV